MKSTIDQMITHAKFLSRHLNPRRIDKCTTAVLLELGVAPGRDGFQYAKQCILIHYYEPHRQMTKDVYPAVGAMRSPLANGVQVERAIRDAISEAWENRDEAVWERFFPLNDDSFIDRPLNSSFISRVARFLEVWQGCYEEVGNDETIE